MTTTDTLNRENMSQDDYVAAKLHMAHPDHDLRCCWHVVMAHMENYALDNDDMPSDDLMYEQAENALGDMCYCDR